MIKSLVMASKPLEINENDTILQIQEKFTARFPYLKIEFFKEPTVTGKGTAKKLMHTHEKTLKELQWNKKSGRILLDKKLKVQELEDLFLHKFGLYTQVFRKSGNIWLETSATDQWTLEQQNNEGMSLQDDIRTERENPEDHDIY